MYSHIMVGTNDPEKARKFYDAVFGALGVGPAGPGRLFYMTPTGAFAVSTPIDGQPATHANGGTIGFSSASPEQTEAWHAAGIANGGVTAGDPPGVRDTPVGKMYMAYLRDPDGNKLCAVHRM